MSVRCEFRLTSWRTFSLNSALYTCTVTSAELPDPWSKIEKFYGDHEGNGSNEDVKAIRFKDTNVNYFPRDLNKHFPNLTHVKIENCVLKEISRSDLRGLEGLQYLGIINCQLTSLPDNLFTRMKNLKTISFRNHKIESASSKLLKPFVGRYFEGISFVCDSYLMDHSKLSAAADSERSLQVLMQTIDQSCSKPVHAPRRAADSDPTDAIVKIKELWTSGRFSDLDIVVDSKRFKVHKTIIGMQSSVLGEIIEDHRDANEINIQNFSASAVEALLIFIYTGEVQDDENAVDNFTIADKFQVTKMKSIYEEVLCDQLNDSNAFKFFELGHRHSADLLKKDAFAIIDCNFPDRLPAELLMENPEKLKKFIDGRRNYEDLEGERGKYFNLIPRNKS